MSADESPEEGGWDANREKARGEKKVELGRRGWERAGGKETMIARGEKGRGR